MARHGGRGRFSARMLDEAAAGVARTTAGVARTAVGVDSQPELPQERFIEAA